MGNCHWSSAFEVDHPTTAAAHGLRYATPVRREAVR